MSDTNDGSTIEPTATDEGNDAGAVQSPTLKRTVRHAYVAWEIVPTKPGEPFHQFRVMRGETYDFPREIVERYEPLGAFMPEEETGTEPPVGGTLVALSANPSPEEVLSFVRSARAIELAEYVRDHPAQAGAIGEALSRVMSTLPPRPEGQTTVDGASTNDGTKANPTEGTDNNVTEPDGPSGAPDNLAANRQAAADNADEPPPADPDYKDPGVEDPATVVAGSVQDVVNYLGDHPDQANAILQAENARTNNQPRPGVVKSCAAAAAHIGG